MLRKLLIIIFISLPLFGVAEELTLQQIKSQQSQQVGKVHFSKWFFDVYDAELYSENGHFSWDKPFLLKIHYLRSFSGKNIANHTVKEIAEQHPQLAHTTLDKYKEIFTRLMPDVKNGTNLYGYMDKDGNGYIYSDKGLLGEIPNKTLSKYFFEIWLSDKSSHIKLSKQLRGL
ncbi:chalcone isomerase family protein [Francisella tularensis]|uniref:chalcone isomerase family protein n=2 Tax=Francisella tularensis TaxID=263 RepID=UPI0005178BA0|nr:chalcone isomerase family protein [Francisella tularensis]AKH92838.1 NADH dehydrogenase [Francisella tularensis subsp. tularensis WY-00W4114]MBK2015157.1 chalcone isomerase family protein [Francisella tularensis subsp. tularensis]MBK2017400.1 chalcone isomerase family protein [Francisella tularensis subsp. tularensis]MBK2019277.1 chalcone isomerase family protein [Francisella tularensis subsp. tularensis]MBK2023714.1 chalcone isomerase family protein [Francisella tularensis subsp. tularensi